MTVKIPLSKRGKYAGLYEAVVDDCDADLAELNWSVLQCPNNSSQQAIRMDYSRKQKKQIRLHRVVLSHKLGRSLKGGEQVNFVDDNSLNCRRMNLRIATHMQNMWHRKTHRNNTSGFKGVDWHKPTYKWRASIQVAGRKIHLGSFDIPEDAHAAYCEAAKKEFGEFANLGNTAQS